MAADRRRGLKRLAIAIGVPWFAFWGLAGYLNYRAYKSYAELLTRALGEQDMDMAALWARNQTIAEKWMAMSIWCGVIGPLILLIVGAVAYWVYRGFRPRN